MNYQYEIIGGPQTGFKHKVDGIGIVDNDLKEAFAKLNVHLAVIDDIFHHSEIEVQDIDTMHNDPRATLYNVTGFRIKGNDESGAVILKGNKYLSGGARMELETPRTPMDDLSSYKWHNELKTAVDKCLLEVALYHAGKYTLVEEEEKPEKARQLTIAAGQDDDNDDFEANRI